MSQARIRAAFESRLAEWAAAQSLPVVWQNVSIQLPTGNHLRAYLLPAGTTSRDVAGDNRSYRGVFQVSVFTMPGQGAGRAEQTVRGLEALFPLTLCMDSGELRVRVITPMSAGPAVQEADWFIVPVSCRYEADDR